MSTQVSVNCSAIPMVIFANVRNYSGDGSELIPQHHSRIQLSEGLMEGLRWLTPHRDRHVLQL